MTVDLVLKSVRHSTHKKYMAIAYFIPCFITRQTTETGLTCWKWTLIVSHYENGSIT